MLACATLSACGGGGGGSGVGSSGTIAPPVTTAAPVTPTPSAAYADPVPPPPGYVVTPAAQQPTRSANDTDEYRANYTAKEYIHALYALDNGWDGHGVEVGVIDGGVNTANTTEFVGQISDKSRDFGTVKDANGATTARNSLGDDHSDHGTPVAGIIAAARDGTGTMGVAPGAKLVVLRIDDVDNSTATPTHNYTHALEALDYATKQKLRIVNMSLTVSGTDTTAAAFVQRFGANGGLLVNAAGNEHLDNPADAFLVTPANRDTWLFVGALSTTGTGYTLASYSNKAGTMADRYVVAMGDNKTVQVDGTIGSFSGTSSATPMVSGLAALILSKWPQLTGKDAGNIILATAKDLGDPGVDAIYGHGLVDAQAALSPVNPVVSNGAQTASVAQTVAVVPQAMSPAGLAKAVSEVTVIDQFGRDYSGSLAAAVIKPESRDPAWLRRRMALMTTGGESQMAFGNLSGSFGFATYVTGPLDTDRLTRMTAGRIDYASGAWSFSAGVNAAESMQSDIMGLAPFSDAVLAYAPAADTSVGAKYAIGGTKVGMTFSSGAHASTSATAASVSIERGKTMLRASYIQERGSVMGSVSGGGLALGRGATTTVIEARQAIAFGPAGWNLEGYGSIGVTNLQVAPGSMITGASALIGTRLGVQASGPAFGGLLSLGLAQPLTVESGTAHLTLATGYDEATRSLIYGQRDASLAASDRRLQMTAGFARGGPKGNFRFGVAQGIGYADTRATLSYGSRF